MNVVVAAEIRLTYILCTLFDSPVLSAGQLKSPLSRSRYDAPGAALSRRLRPLPGHASGVCTRVSCLRATPAQ